MLAASWGTRRGVAGVLEGSPAALGAVGERAANVAASGDVIAAVDGDIYNSDELRLAGTAAAQLVSLYLQHGIQDALRRVNGDFAAALYDARAQTLWLARDRFGVKPLYYAATPSGVAFASRPRALFEAPGVSRSPDRRFVGLFAGSHYRYFDNAPASSPYADIAQLPAAHVLKVKDGRREVSAYWRLEDEDDYGEPEAVLAERYRELLLDAVQRRLSGLERPAFTLSGGMDSSSVLASAVRVSRRMQPALSTVYEDRTYDESDDIRSILDETVSEWHTVTVGDPDVAAVVRRQIEAHDEPVATATWLSHFLLCEKAAALGFDGLFGGMGGDELNAGEYEHFLYFFADLRAAGEEARLAAEIAMWQRHHDHPLYKKDRAVAEEALARLTQTGGTIRPDRTRLERYRATLRPDFFDLGSFEPVLEHPFASHLKNRTYQDLMRETIPCCLRAEDRQTTAFGLAHRLPFLDHRLVEFMFRVPSALKYSDGVTKRLLREAMKGIVPEATRTRVKKTGWNAPAHQWFSGPGYAFLMDLIRSQAFRERGIYDLAEVERLAREHEEIVTSGALRENHMMFFWQLVNLELWLQSLGR
jgi:asparagine synthase (glutamine-hydrolysing)